MAAESPAPGRVDSTGKKPAVVAMVVVPPPVVRSVVIVVVVSSVTVLTLCQYNFEQFVPFRAHSVVVTAIAGSVIVNVGVTIRFLVMYTGSVSTLDTVDNTEVELGPNFV